MVASLVSKGLAILTCKNVYAGCKLISRRAMGRTGWKQEIMTDKGRSTFWRVNALRHGRRVQEQAGQRHRNVVKHSSVSEPSSCKAGMAGHRRHRHARRPQPPVQLDGEKQVRELADAIAPEPAEPLHCVEVVPIDLRPPVLTAAGDDDPRSGRFHELGKEQRGEREAATMVDAEVQFEALRRVLQLRSHHRRTLDDTIDVRLPSRKIGCAPHARKICPVERQEREVYP
jgi:hypothetical protein